MASQRQVGKGARVFLCSCYRVICSACFAGVLSVVLHPSIDWRMSGGQFVIAAVLGAGEVGFAVVLGASIDMILRWVRSGQESDESRAVLAKSGWMRHFVALRQASLFAWVCISTLYVCGEELIYRALCLKSLAHWGAVESIVLASALFVAIQVFHMPSWRAALYPIIGASVVGLFHAWLFLHQAQITPLVVAGTTSYDDHGAGGATQSFTSSRD